MPSQSPFRIEPTKDERPILRKRAGAHTAPHWEVVRAKIVLLAARRDLQQGDRPEALHQPSNGLQVAQAVPRGGVRWIGGSTTLGQTPDLSPLR